MSTFSTTFKFSYEGELRRVQLEGRKSLVDLLSFVKDAFPSLGNPLNIKLLYIDDEGDFCTISSELELDEAYRLVENSENQIFRIVVQRSNDLPSSCGSSTPKSEEHPFYAPSHHCRWGKQRMCDRRRRRRQKINRMHNRKCGIGSVDDNRKFFSICDEGERKNCFGFFGRFQRENSCLRPKIFMHFIESPEKTQEYVESICAYDPELLSAIKAFLNSLNKDESLKKNLNTLRGYFKEQPFGKKFALTTFSWSYLLKSNEESEDMERRKKQFLDSLSEEYALLLMSILERVKSDPNFESLRTIVCLRGKQKGKKFQEAFSTWKRDHKFQRMKRLARIYLDNPEEAQQHVQKFFGESEAAQELSEKTIEFLESLRESGLLNSVFVDDNNPKINLSFSEKEEEATDPVGCEDKGFSSDEKEPTPIEPVIEISPPIVESPTISEFAEALRALEEMGFMDTDRNIAALYKTKGNLLSAIHILLA